MNRVKFPIDFDPSDPKLPEARFWGPISSVDSCIPWDSQIIMEVTHPECCPVCGHPDLQGIAVVYGWPIYACNHCGVGFVWPQPSDDLLSDYYSRFWDNYLNNAAFVYDRTDLKSKIYMREAEYTARLLDGNRSARVLDIGAGDGTFLRCLQDMGFEQACGLDRDEMNCRRARDGLGVKIAHGDFLDYSEGDWDAICLWATIEHLKDPMAYARKAFDLLKGGAIYRHDRR